MPKKEDPRIRGFNYGRGWGSAPKPPVYQAAAQLALDLARCARVISDRWWELEMKLRDVRLAGTPEEKERSITALAQAYAQYEAYLSEAVETVCTIEGSRNAA